MKRLIIALTVISLLLTACAGALSPTPTPIPTIRPRPTRRLPPRVSYKDRSYYKIRCWPACHYRPTPVVHLFTDDFDGALGSGWSWINEDPTHWTLTEAPGILRIVSQGGTISEDLQEAQNVLVRDAPAGHFDIITEVTFNPTTNFQNATIFIQQNDGSLVSLSRGYCQEGDGPSCVGSGVYFHGPEPNCTIIDVPTSAKTVFLMIRKAGASYIGYYGLDEDNWVEVGRCTSMATPVTVGLTATNGSRDPDIPQIPADFDFFILQER